MDYSAPAGEKSLQIKVMKVGGRNGKPPAEGAHRKVDSGEHGRCVVRRGERGPQSERRLWFSRLWGKTKRVFMIAEAPKKQKPHFVWDCVSYDDRYSCINSVSDINSILEI